MNVNERCRRAFRDFGRSENRREHGRQTGFGTALCSLSRSVLTVPLVTLVSLFCFSGIVVADVRPPEAADPVEVEAGRAKGVAAAEEPAEAERGRVWQNEWRVLSTDHFVISYPRLAEEWVRLTAEELERSYLMVVDAVGWAPKRKIQVLVDDPLGAANGLAVPHLREPQMILYTNPPNSTSALSNFRTFPEVLALHENVHMVHMMRPTRWHLAKLVTGITGMGPLALLPSWVTEGYATYLEGKLTGTGRPSSAYRSSYLRQRAADGSLASLSNLSDRQGRYLVGSAFIEWLAAEHGDESLRNLWRKMSARRFVGFEKSFKAIYGESAATLYRRFAAEQIHQALELESTRPEAPSDEWLRHKGMMGIPALSPDGSKLVVPMGSRKQGANLTVWQTEDDPESITKWEEAQARRLKADPQDVASQRPKTLGRKRAAKLKQFTSTPWSARWSSNEEIVFTTPKRGVDGRRHWDVYRWRVGARRAKQVTYGEDIRMVDVSPGENWAIGVQSRWGKQSIVRLSLDSGDVEVLHRGGAGVVFDTPRIDRVGKTVLVASNRGAGWVLERLDISTNRLVTIRPPKGVLWRSPQWSADGKSLWVVQTREGFSELAKLNPVTLEIETVTQTAFGVAHGVVHEPSGQVYYLEPRSESAHIRRAPLTQPMGLPVASNDVDPGWVTALPPGENEVAGENGLDPAPWGNVDLSSVQSEDYRFWRAGRAIVQPMLQADYTPGFARGTAGFSFLDRVSKHRLQVRGELDNERNVAGSLAYRLRLRPFSWTTQVVATQGVPASSRPGQYSATSLLSFVLPYRSSRIGVSAGADKTISHRPFLVPTTTAPQDTSEQVSSEVSAYFGRTSFFGELDGTLARNTRSSRIGVRFNERVSVEVANRSGTQLISGIEAFGRRRHTGLTVGYRRGMNFGAGTPSFLLGGIESSTLSPFSQWSYVRMPGVSSGDIRTSVTGAPYGRSFDTTSMKLSYYPAASGKYALHLRGDRARLWNDTTPNAGGTVVGVEGAIFSYFRLGVNHWLERPHTGFSWQDARWRAPSEWNVYAHFRVDFFGELLDRKP